MSRIKTVGIIGGGVSGLAAALSLSRQGLRVQLFEANDKLGGCCANTRLSGYTFNDGAMYVAVPQLLDSAFAQLGLDRRATVPLRRIAANQMTTLSDGTLVTIGDGSDVRVLGRNGDQRSARLASEIDALMQRWLPVLEVFSNELLTQPFSAALLLRRSWRHLPKLLGTLSSELRRAFADPAARAAMAGMLLYTGVPVEKAPAFHILGLVALFDAGFYLPEGGMDAITSALAAALRSQGGEIFTDAKVGKIKTTRGRVSGLEVQGHGNIAVDAVISTVSGMLTFGSLLDDHDVPAAMRRKVQRAPLSHRAVSVQLGLSNELEGVNHSNSVLPMMEEQYRLLLASRGAPEWFNYTVPTVTMPELAPPGGSVIEMFPPIDQDLPIERWDEQATEAVVESAIAALSRTHRLDVAVKRVQSPKDYRDRMHLFGGALYGLSPAADPRAQFPHQTPLEGLFQAGQTTYPGFGVSTAALSGIFAAQALLKTMRG
jgi:phytoene desaturase